MTFDRRIFNFSAGPATLPAEVLQQAADELLNWHGLGTSVMEISHRSKEFMVVYEEALQDLRSLMHIPDNYEVLLLQGGGIGQNAAVPLNLMSLAPHGPKADFIVTGVWSEKSIKEAEKYGVAHLAATSVADHYRSIPARTTWQLSSDAAYVHYCANETIGGVEFQSIPEVGTVPLVADISSNILSREFDVSRCGVCFAGAQKNIGPAGAAIVIIRRDLITPTDMVVTLSHTGYMKSQPLSEYRAQKRGGRGKQAATTKDEDWIDTLFVANTHDTILCFSDRGRMYWLKVWEVPQGSRTSRGKPIVNMFPLIEGEKITVILPIKGYQDDHFVFMATSLGTVKKTRLSDFSNPRKGGIIAVDLNENDFLVGAAITDGKHDVMLFSDAGKAVRFDENDVRPMGRTARGVRGMNLGPAQQVIAMLVAPAEFTEVIVDGVVVSPAIALEGSENVTTANVMGSVLTATENGFGKRTPIAEYTRHGRGTKGMIAIQTTERNGKVVAAALVSPEDQIMLITTGGVLVRTRVAEIREMGRATQGVTLINVDEGTRLSGLQRIAESDTDDDGDEIDTDGGLASEGTLDGVPDVPADDADN